MTPYSLYSNRVYCVRLKSRFRSKVSRVRTRPAPKNAKVFHERSTSADVGLSPVQTALPSEQMSKSSPMSKLPHEFHETSLWVDQMVICAMARVALGETQPWYSYQRGQSHEYISKSCKFCVFRGMRGCNVAESKRGIGQEPSRLRGGYFRVGSPLLGGGR
ncbi:hypothetical protein F441_17257 [Phytophthora nicotianae CJ01A1]|uniref:Uncharacterized protein n=2 Tax=Phytophthora nicotianae TaxID=4792 RepID=W2I7S0_PHYNI|nr:hypothetical protein L915_16908 [Phytophthora nicotianae]ETL30181.1 hypothetical protein L916_16811 [Phytophthora nicotianae]ETM36623.1 hypothetical protein L914_16733 [Phytophthora nicotianae]ETP06343.1 hypothetical protein F441_17257 [Phytophthora nicotianae CJ01A1]